MNTIATPSMARAGIAPEIHKRAIEDTHDVIRPYIRRTPTAPAAGSDFDLPNFELHLKLEHLQHAGSFKTRGAFANLLTRKIPPEGVVAASGGNHGAAVAYGARRLGVRAKIFVPSVSSQPKVDRIRAYGADLEIAGSRYADALTASEDWAERTGALRVHAFDQVETILGQASLAAELSAQLPDLDTILAPARVGELTFPLVQRFVSSVVLVADEAIVSAQLSLWDRMRMAVEPAGATALAAVLSKRYIPARDERVAVVISGGNWSWTT